MSVLDDANAQVRSIACGWIEFAGASYIHHLMPGTGGWANLVIHVVSPLLSRMSALRRSLLRPGAGPVVAAGDDVRARVLRHDGARLQRRAAGPPACVRAKPWTLVEQGCQ